MHLHSKRSWLIAFCCLLSMTALGGCAAKDPAQTTTRLNGEQMYNLGMEASRGNLAPASAADYETTRDWLSRSAGAGYLPAIHALGWMYFKGLGVAVDQALAASHFRAAAEQGYAESQYLLGLMYVQGWGVEKDSGLSLQWIKRAADQGHPASQKLLKNLFNASGKPVE